MDANYIIKPKFLDDLKGFVDNDNKIKMYFADKFEIDIKHLQSAKLFKTKCPALKVPKSSWIKKLLSESIGIGDKSASLEHDFENAVILYESLNLNRIQASDPRLWTYLCHVPYYTYIKKRHLPRTRKNKYLDIDKFYDYSENEQQTIRNYIKQYFFTESDNRTLRKNALSGLWWAVELSIEPWERYDGVQKISDDKYYYTKVLIEDTNLYQGTIERVFGQNPKMLFPIIDLVIDKNMGKDSKANLFKKVNSILAFRNLSNMNYDEIKKEFNTLI